MPSLEPAVRDDYGYAGTGSIAAGRLRTALRSAAATGRTALAAGGLALSLLIILVAPARAAGAEPGHAPRLAALEWLTIGCILVGLIQAVRWLAGGSAALAAHIAG